LSASSPPVACGRTRLFQRVLGWLSANLDQFDPLINGPWPDSLRNRALAELAFLCECIRKAEASSNDEMDRIASFIASVWTRPEYQDLVVRNPRSLQLYALTYASLARCGVDVSASAPIIQGVVDAGYATAVEAAPFRLMDLRGLLDRGGFHHEL